jgi:hypothetical protein
MAYQIRYKAEVLWVGDGLGPMGLPGAIVNAAAGAQVLAFLNSTVIPVPGGDAPTSGNFGTAATAVATDLTTQLQNAATLARLQAFATGGA